MPTQPTNASANDPARDGTLLPAALPAFCTARVILITLALGVALSLLLSLVPGVAEERWSRFGTTLWLVTWIALVTVALLCATRRWLQHLPLTGLLAAVVLLLLGVTAVSSAVAFSALQSVGWESSETVTRFVLHNLAIALVVGLLGIWVFSLHLANARQINAAAEAELSALHARIRPHFLFNSLNTVAELIHERPEAAEQAVLDLSRVFRAALAADERVSLAEEIELARRYLDLEHWRLGERLHVDWQLPEPLPEIRLPVLTIQPLVENAVRHSIECQQSAGAIRIECQVGQRSISLVIENDLVPGKRDKGDGNGMALANIADRLALVFGEAASLRAGPVDGRFRVKLVIPHDGGTT
ncbi:histidine kinase [Guyparkeria hydrothermalis]|uniref:sensor histidine kinase n=1 Tax=Guyparkeria hydrothermalis TaxID=923 RepID=UPI00202090D0|nr:histidine kinase [Guyparkeria hydrothermalis]MCL7744998.1 histidine kinase [Guyparkeria hydrothermalis]